MKEERDWIASCPECKRVVCWHMGGPDAAKDVARWIKIGLNVERATTEDARAMPWGHSEGCPHYRQPEPKQQPLFAGKAGE